MYKADTILKKHIETIATKMNYEDEPFSFTGNGNYFTWPNKTEEDVLAIEKATGIKCKLSQQGTLLVPEYDDFKSEKQKKLLLDLDQYGVTMMYLDLAKKSSHSDLKIICKQLFHILAEKVDEGEMRAIVEDVIDKIS